MIACMMLFSTAMFAEKGDTWLGGGFSYGLSSDYKNFGIGVKGQYELLEKFRADAMVDYFFRHEDVSFFDINLNAQYLWVKITSTTIPSQVSACWVTVRMPWASPAHSNSALMSVAVQSTTSPTSSRCMVS